MDKINLLFVTLFGIGNVKFLPGTCGSFVTCIFLFAIFHILNITSNFILIFLILVLFYSIFAISYSLINFKDEDPKQIVIDEFIGWYPLEEKPHIQQTRSTFTIKELERIKKILEK